MSNLIVQNIGTDRDASLVVDSRLIAEVLGVGHSDWVRNVIKKYQTEIEEDFGQLRFENGYVDIPNGGKKETIYALLSEDQATCLMTYSKNTEQVRAAKRNLVKSFSKAKDALKAIIEPVEPIAVPIALPPADVRVSNLNAALLSFGIELDNPRYAQGLKDITLNILGLGQQTPALTPSPEVWAGVAERALDLGYKPNEITKHRSALGKFVKKFGLRMTEEKRLVNGGNRPVMVYLVCPKLDAAICQYFDQIAA